MLYVKSGIINPVSLTLRENTTISPVYYLFEFQNDFTKDKLYKLPPMVSSNSRYTEFHIDLGEDGFSMTPSGWWSYKVYQQTSETNLDPLLSQGLIEKGKLLVDEGDIKEVETIKYISDNENNSNYVFVDLEGGGFERKIWGQTQITFGQANWVWSQSE